jgi:hypothetical protein
LKKLQSDLAEHVSRFTKRYNPDSRIIAYLRKRAEEFRTELPAFLLENKKRIRPQPQRRPYPGYLSCAKPVCISNHVSHTHDTAQCHYYSPKGKGTKGKVTGQRQMAKGKGERPSLTFHVDGKGKGSKGKKGTNISSKGLRGAKGTKGKPTLGNRVIDSMSSSSSGVTNISENFKPITCDFCHKPNHVRQNCRKLQALNNSKTYRQARDRHENRRQFIFNMLENSVFSPHACSWCLSSECDGIHCYPPDDPVYFTETNNIFYEEILPLVKNAKLELPLDSADPLIPYQFYYEDSGWGQQWDSNFNFDEEQLGDSWDYDTASDICMKAQQNGVTNCRNLLMHGLNLYHLLQRGKIVICRMGVLNSLINQGSSVHNTDTEDAAPGPDINEEEVGLIIEEDDVEEPDLGNSSSSSAEEI